MNHKYLLSVILLIVLVIALLGAGYFYFFKKNSLSDTSSIFPDWFRGNDKSTSQGEPVVEPEDGLNESTSRVSPLYSIFREPTSGFTLALQEDVQVIRFVEQSTGNFFETNLDTLATFRLSNDTIPKILEAQFTNNASKASLRYLAEDHESIRTYLVDVPNSPLGTSTSQAELKGVFLPENITSITAHPSLENFFYIQEQSNGSQGYLVSSGAPGQRVFTSPLKEWSARFISPTQIALTTKASSGVPGYLYVLNPSTGTLSRTLGDIYGLTSLVRNDSGVVLYSESTGSNNLELNLFKVSSNTSYALPLSTLPEKCIWSTVNKNRLYCGVPRMLPAGDYPDSWYRGDVSFTDDLWVLDATTGNAELITDFAEYEEGLSIDLIDPQLSPNDDYLVFKNKRDGSLWSFNLPENFE